MDDADKERRLASKVITKLKKRRKPKVHVEKPAIQVWTEGFSTMDGQRCHAMFNVTNWH